MRFRATLFVIQVQSTTRRFRIAHLIKLNELYLFSKKKNYYLIEIECVEIVFGGIAGAGTQVEFTGQLVAVEPSPFQTNVVADICCCCCYLLMSVLIRRQVDDAPCCRRQ